MQPQQPPPPADQPAGPAFPRCSLRLGLMEGAVDALVAEVDLGAAPAAERIAAGLLAELGPAVADLAHEHASGQALVRAQLEGLAAQLEAAANRHGYWPLHGIDRSPMPIETQLRAVIARLRLVARN